MTGLAASGDLPPPLNPDKLDATDGAKYVMPLSSALSSTHLIRRVSHRCYVRVFVVFVSPFPRVTLMWFLFFGI